MRCPSSHLFPPACTARLTAKPWRNKVSNDKRVHGTYEALTIRLGRLAQLWNPYRLRTSSTKTLYFQRSGVPYVGIPVLKVIEGPAQSRDQPIQSPIWWSPRDVLFHGFELLSILCKGVILFSLWGPCIQCIQCRQMGRPDSAVVPL